LCEYWCKDWTKIFKKTLKDIKAGINYNADKDNQSGKCVVNGPLSNREEWLAVYFTVQNGKYSVYMIKLENSNDVHSANFSSLKH
jgi:hypothetical protein